MSEESDAKIIAAWRRRCPDVTDEEALDLAAVDLDGPTTRTALNAHRAGRAMGRAEGRAANPRGRQVYRIPPNAPALLAQAVQMSDPEWLASGEPADPWEWAMVHAAVDLINRWRQPSTDGLADEPCPNCGIREITEADGRRTCLGCGGPR
jgi:hypothetical protein